MKLSTVAREKLKQLEGFRGVAYIPVPGDVPTIGYGFTHGVKMGDKMTLEQADRRLITELVPYEQAVERGCKLAPNQNQFDAMVLLCFNIGIAGFLKSTALRCHNAGDFQAAARAFGLWNKSSGKVYAGLTRRRAEESALYLTETDNDPLLSMPQRIDQESSMAASPINRAGVVAGGTATVAGVTEAARTGAGLKYTAQSLGDWVVPILLVCGIGLCGYMVWERIKQRKNGWA